MESNTKENLELSIKLLGQEDAQRKSFLRLSSSSSAPRRILLQQSKQLHRNSDGLREFNGTFAANISTKSNLGTRLPKINDLFGIDTSLTIDANDINSILMASERSDITLREIMEGSSATGTILKADKPWRDVNTKLYYDFLHSVQTHSSATQIFDTLSDFIQNCTDTLELMRDMQSKVENTEISKEEICLENERNTWRLIYCLYQNRISTEYQNNVMDMVINNLYTSENDVVENLYKNAKYIREYQLVIDWLEKNALDRADKCPTVEHFTDKTVAWENTLHQLHSRHIGIAFASSRPLVSSLDPDAPVREGRPLHDLDREDDARLEKRMFIEIRCGRLQKAQSLALHCGQPWRAACLLGWIPYHDPNYRNPLLDTKLPVEGNPQRSLWKLCAWELSRDKRVGQFYRAIYASLCGNVQQLLQIAESWEDALWSYMKTLLDIKVEAELRATVARSYTDMPEEYWKNEIRLEDIFKELHASQNLSIRTQSNEPVHLIQQYLILDQIPKLMEEVETFLDSGSCDSQILRFLAHLVLFLRQIGKSTKNKMEVRVLSAYVRVLMELGDPVLVAFYAATLPQEDQIVNYAEYLEQVTDYEERRKCLIAAKDANLNVEAITKMVVERIRTRNVEIESSDLKGSITDADIDKIDALDWLLFYSNQREEALWQANALIRYFLTNGKIDAAQRTFGKIPSDTIESIMTEYPTMEDTIANLTVTNNLSKKASSSIREYLCYKTYLDAQEGFTEWFSHYHHGKPAEVQDLPQFATFTEKVAHDHKKAQYNVELERWKCTMQHHTKAVKQLLFNVLLFPDGGWLVDSNGNDKAYNAEDVLREHQLEKLRELCIPKITLLLHSVMSQMEQHTECVQLADTLASEQHQLYKVFPKAVLREVLKKICESSLVLMDQKKDPWGY